MSKNFELSELARKITVDNSNVAFTGVTLPSTSLENTGVTAGEYGSSSSIPVINVNSKGQLTSVTTVALPTGLATETYVNNAVAGLASETYVNTAISTLIDNSPAALDTLNELAASLGDDPNFATTITNALASKASNDALNALEAYVNARLPSGFIGMWSGSVATIPTGWLLCDGANGTPNLQDRFIVGAGSTYSVAATGGSANATLPAHTHTGSTSVVGNHSHTTSLISRAGSQWTVNRPPAWGGDDATSPGGEKAASTNTVGDHSHSFTTSSTGDSATNANLPPYYALAYIMKA